MARKDDDWDDDWDDKNGILTEFKEPKYNDNLYAHGSVA